MMTPFAWLAQRFSLGRRTLRWAAAAALVASVLIIVTGSIVRVTGSGLGCDTWPSCTAENLAPTAELGLHGAIEFGNRLLTIVLCAVIGWLIVAARLQRESVPGVTRWAWAQFWVIVLNAVVGGVTVWMRLSPYIVAAHFLAATLLLAAATVTLHKVAALDSEQPTSPSAIVAGLGATLLVTTAVLITLGTLVTGTGPHAGDSSDIPRMPFNWATVTAIHAGLAMLVITIAVILWFRTARSSATTRHRRVAAFVGVFAAQGITGIVQVLASLPETVVVMHALGSALVWIGAIRVFLDTRRFDLDRKKIEYRAATERG